MSWRGILTLLLLVGAAISGWAVWTQRSVDAPATAASQRPDYLLRDFELIALNGEGKESFTLRGPELARNPNDKTMALITPLFLLPDKQGKYWEVRSKTGWVSASHDEIRLRGEVKASSPAEELRPTTINTEQLNVFPNSDRATSAAAVTIVQPGSILRGTGMDARLDSKRIRLKSNVKVRYVSPGR